MSIVFATSMSFIIKRRLLKKSSTIIYLVDIPSHTSQMTDVLSRLFGKKVATLMDEAIVLRKNDLDKREDINDKRLAIMETEEAQACLVAFNVVCSYICTRDLIQEHIGFRVWPLINEWEMSNEIEDRPSQSAGKGGLVYLKYTYTYINHFGEPCDEWFEAVEETCDEMLGAYTNAKDKAMNTAFGARGKR
jgi:hypothetical protein